MTEWTFDEESLFGMLIVDFFLLGGISGQIYGSPNAEDGDFIETSPIKDGPIENGYVVETVTGSRYFLSPGEGVKATNLFDAFKDMALKRGGTITIPKDSNEKKVGDALNILSSGKPRSTFSLFDLWQGFGEDNKTKSPASNGLKAPNGVPMLSGWNTNKDGSITGIIYGSRTLDDGALITTSPIVEGQLKRNEIVKTASGSRYFLG